MTAGRRPSPTRSIALVGAGETLPGLDRVLARHGLSLIRVAVIQPVPTPAQHQSRVLEQIDSIDTLLVTSRATVRLFLAMPSVRARLLDPLPREVFAVGPATARSLRRAGYSLSWVGTTGGSATVERRLARARLTRRIFYPRSSLAGPGLGRRLRARGHWVFDPVVYRIVSRPRLSRTDVNRLLKADRVVASSPSALSALRGALPPRSFDRLRHRPGLIVLGARSARAARGHGFRSVRTAPVVAEQGFTRFLLRELRRDEGRAVEGGAAASVARFAGAP